MFKFKVMMYKETKTVMFKGLNKDHSANAVYEYERTVWYMFGFIPVWFKETNPVIIHDFKVV